MPKPTFTLRRHGLFTIRPWGNNHCGDGNPYILQCSYDLLVRCDEKLDERGFLFENGIVQKYFDDIEETNKSCELLAQGAAYAILDIIRTDSPDCRPSLIEVRISPRPFAASAEFSLPLEQSVNKPVPTEESDAKIAGYIARAYDVLLASQQFDTRTK